MYNEKRLTKITIENHNNTFSWETPYNDSDLYEDIIHAFYSMLIGIGYSPSGVLESFKEFAEEYLPTVDSDYVDEEYEDNNANFKPGSINKGDYTITSTYDNKQIKFIETPTDESGFSCGAGFE